MARSSKINISLDLRIVCIALVLIILAMLALWRPWQDTGATGRTIAVNGDASIEAEPDEYLFSPTYQQKGGDRATVQKELTDKVNGVIAELKKLGVAEADIQLASNTYDNYWREGPEEISANTISIKVTNKELSQKVQDYLLTTSPEGQISPMASFSDAKRKEITNEVRNLAIQDARKNAETTASELGMKLGKVVTVGEAENSVMPIDTMIARGSIGAAETKPDSISSLPVLPGKQKIPYTVKVTYELK